MLIFFNQTASFFVLFLISKKNTLWKNYVSSMIVSAKENQTNN